MQDRFFREFLEGIFSVYRGGLFDVAVGGEYGLDYDARRTRRPLRILGRNSLEELGRDDLLDDGASVRGLGKRGSAQQTQTQKQAGHGPRPSRSDGSERKSSAKVRDRENHRKLHQSATSEATTGQWEGFRRARAHIACAENIR